MDLSTKVRSKTKDEEAKKERRCEAHHVIHQPFKVRQVVIYRTLLLKLEKSFKWIIIIRRGETRFKGLQPWLSNSRVNL